MPGQHHDAGAVELRATVTGIVSARNAALERAREAADLLARGHQLADEAAKLARHAHGGALFRDVDHARDADMQRLFQRIDPAASVEAFRRSVDASTWVRLMDIAGIRGLMDRTAVDELRASLSADVPEVTEESVRETVMSLMENAELIFQRGLARVFSDLDRRFRSHDAFKVGSRIILTNVFDGYGGWNYYNSARETITDVERVFAVLDKAPPDGHGLVRAVEESRRGYGPRQGVVETAYFRIRTFKNGNAHLWMLRDDLVTRANQLLAAYYGAVLPDAVPGATPESKVRSDTGALSRDLAFYPTPPAVVLEMCRELYLSEASRVLEPSAGTGGIVSGLLESGANVHAIEVDAGRHAQLAQMARSCPRLRVTRANFLGMQPDPTYTHVLMNPPFCGTHWMEHVVHAYDFLAPGGVLVAVLPVTAELGETRKHRAFREWATQRARYQRLRFRDLPPESFASSGTRISTVLLTLVRR